MTETSMWMAKVTHDARDYFQKKVREYVHTKELAKRHKACV